MSINKIREKVKNKVSRAVVGQIVKKVRDTKNKIVAGEKKKIE